MYTFSDISTNAKTKEEYLSKGCQARIRGYLSKSRSQLFATKLNSILVNSARDEIEAETFAATSINSHYNKSKRKTLISPRSLRFGLNADNEEVKTLDEENWDEIDATLLRNYRGEFTNDSIIKCRLVNFSIIMKASSMSF